MKKFLLRGLICLAAFFMTLVSVAQNRGPFDRLCTPRLGLDGISLTRQPKLLPMSAEQRQAYLNNRQKSMLLVPPGCTDLIVDGGFETGGIPSIFWNPETSTNFGTPLCDVPSCGTGGGASPPRTGAIWAWFGGIPAPETATLGQTMTIPVGTASLDFYMRIGTVSSPFTDVLNVRVDGVIVQSYPEPAVAEGAYTLRTINLNAYADGGSHAILFEYIGPSSGTGSYVVDDVELASCPLGGPIPLIISEFRLRGPSGANDEYIEIYNTSNTPYTVVAVSGTGLGVAASDGVTRFSIPNGTVIPAHGHYLGVNSVAYSISAYPAGNGTTATGDATYAIDIADNAGIALFDNNVGGASYALANRLDAVGSVAEANPVYKEGTGYGTLTPFSIDYCFRRRTYDGPPQDTDNNAVDFEFDDTNGTSAGAGQRLGTPGPENLSGPVSRDANVVITRLDQTVGPLLPPNVVRDFTSDPPNNSTFGTIELRYRITNNTGVPLTRLRLRIDSIWTFPAPATFADLRPRTTSSIVVAGINDPATCLPAGTPCAVTVEGTTLEQPPSQPNGGGFNSSMSVGTVTLGTPLAAGASVNIRLLFGIQQTGTFVLKFTPEILPTSGVTGAIPLPERISGETDLLPCILTCPANITVSNDPNQCGAIVNYPAPTTSGTCGTVTSSPASGSFFPVGTTTVTATSSIGGASCTFTVTVNDTQPPTVTCPANIVLCGSQAVSFTVTASDNCPGVTVVSTPASGSVFPVGTTTVTATATDAVGNTAACTFDVIINQTPFGAATPSSQTICSGNAITTIVLTSSEPGTTYNWTRNNTVTVTGIAASGSGNISGVLTNTTNAPVLVTFTIIPTAAGCAGPSFIADVLVNPSPNVVAAPTSQLICSPNAITTIVLSGNVSGTTFNWTRDNTVNVTGIAATGSGNISGTLTNNTAVQQTVTFTITPTANGCAGTPVTATVTLNPQPLVSPVPANQVVCNGTLTAPVTFTGPVAGTVFNWTNNNTSIGLAASGTGNIAAFTATNPGAVPVVATVTVTPSTTGSGACIPSAPQTFTNSTPVNILDNTVVSSTITVAGAPVYLYDLNMITNITHTFASDLDITITSPAGTVVTLTTDNGGGLDNVFNGTVWNDNANPGGQVPYVNNNGVATDHLYVNLTLASPLTPEEPLGAFIGENPNGVWTIRISDDLGGDIGILSSWSLVVSGLSGAPTLASTSATNSTPVAIPTGPAVVSSNLVVSGAGTVLHDVNLTTFITHTFASDLDITLRSPAGTVVTLTTDNGAGNDNVYNGTVWDDDANPGGQVPYTTNNGLVTDHAYVNLVLASPLAPEEPLAAFIGENPNGTWTITISDDLGGDGGSLNSWTLNLQTATCATGISCTGPPVSFTYTVNPIPTVSPVPANQVVCNGALTAPVNFTGPVAGTIFNWTNNTPSIGLAASGTGNIAAFTATNPGTVPVVATVTVTPSTSGACTPSVPQTFTNSTPVAIPTGPAVVTSTLVVAGAPIYLYDLNIITNLTHTFAADLDITIMSPAGTVVTLTTDNGAGNDNVFNGTVWDDDANPAGQVPYVTNNGVTTDHAYVNLTLASPLTPEEALGAFIGENPNGIWTITISDDLAGDGGSLNSWSLVVSGLTAAPTITNSAFTQSTPVAIPTGPAVVTSTLVVSGAGTQLHDVNLTTLLTHTFAADLDITLRSPAGTIVTLTTDNGAGNDNVFNGTVWDDDANPGGQVPYTTNNGLVTDHAYVNLVLASPLVPEENLAAFIGEDPNGTWTITISDDLAGDGGSLNSWTLNLQTATCVSTVCTGPPVTFTYTVNPTPDAVATPASQTICSDYPFSIVLSGAVSGTTFNWTRDNTVTVTGVAASGSGSISGTLTNNSTVPVTVTFTITPTANGCPGTPITATVLVNPKLTVNAVANQVVCNGGNTSAVTFSSPVPGPVVFSWSNTNTSIGLAASGTGNIPSFVAVNTGAIPVFALITVFPTLTISGITCTGTAMTFIITVNPTPTVNVVANQTVCNRSIQPIVPFSGAVIGTLFSWTNNNTSIGLAASGTGNLPAFTAVNLTQNPVVATITVTPSYTNGGPTCTGTPRTFTITVNPTPIVVATDLFNQRICISDTLVPLVGTPVGGAWTGIGVSGFNFVPPATAIGTYVLTYTYTNSFGCTTSDTTSVKVVDCPERLRELTDVGAVTIFPNPSNGHFNVRLNSTLYNYLGIKTYNMLGQLMVGKAVTNPATNRETLVTPTYSGLVYGRTIPVDLSHLANGTYLLVIYYDDGVRTSKKGFLIVIQK